MKNVNIVFIPKDKITNSQEREIKKLQKKCFGYVDEKEIKEHFFSEGFAMVLVYLDKKVVGILELHKRDCEFEESKLLLSGAAGVCVADSVRKQGIGSKLIKKGLRVLRDNGCAIACMNVDLEVGMHGFYEKLGFKMMDREISFDDIHGKRINSKGAMFILLNSKEIYDQIMSSRKTFHYGKGYW